MLDLNWILLFIACVSPLVILARTWKRAASNRGWRAAAIVVLLVTAIAWFVTPEIAGFLGGGAWFCVLFLPAVGLRKASELAAQGRYGAAQRIVSGLRFLHPARALRDERSLLRALEIAESGDSEGALHLLGALARSNSRLALQAAAQAFRMRGDWAGLLAFCRENLPLVALGRDPAVLPLYFRALGETGAADELVLQLAGRAPGLAASPEHHPTLDAALMLLFAFTGRTSALRRLLETRLRKLHPDAQEFWLATSERTAGELAAGRTRLERLRGSTQNALLRAEIAHRLRGADRLAPPVLAATSEATVRRFESGLTARGNSTLTPRRGATPAVLTFILLNVAMFVVEIALGGSTNADTLHRLGALEPFAVLARGEYWRLFSALFLHYGALHLLFNCYALHVLGPPLENAIGTARFVVSYLVAGLGSSAGVVALWRLQWTQADFLVGASGSVMGIVGAWAGFLLRNRHAPLARSRLANIGFIIVLQTAFDIYTPQVSMGAHLCGLVTGALVGFLIAPASAE
ncbi:MAG: rhomboid family intramembrane serine protease [Chthoniobacterales bacterium]